MNANATQAASLQLVNSARSLTQQQQNAIQSAESAYKLYASNANNDDHMLKVSAENSNAISTSNAGASSSTNAPSSSHNQKPRTKKTPVKALHFLCGY